MTAGARKKRKRRISWYVIWTMIFLFFGAGVVTLFISLPIFQVRSVHVQGTRLLLDEEVLRLANLPFGENIFLMRFNRAEERLLNVPVVKRVRFSRALPATVVINVDERREAVVSVIKGQSLVMDEEGFVMNPHGVMGVGVRLPDITDLPVMSGLKEDWLFEGRRVKSDSGKEILKMLKEFKSFVLPQKLQIDVSEVDDIKLLVDDILKVRVGSVDGLGRKMKVFEAVYSRIKDRKERIDYIDVSSPDFPVARFKD